MTDNELTFVQKIADYCYTEIFGDIAQNKAVEATTDGDVSDAARKLLDSDYAPMMGSAYHFGETGMQPEMFAASDLLARAQQIGDEILVDVLRCLYQSGYRQYSEMNAEAVEQAKAKEAAKKLREQQAKEAIINAHHDDLPDDEIAEKTVHRSSWKANALHRYDVVIHTVGRDTNLPCYFSFLQFPTAKTHIFITSNDEECRKRLIGLRNLLPDGCRCAYEIVDPYNPAETHDAICKAEKLLSEKNPNVSIGVDLTGGTKLMFIGGIHACNELGNAEPFYFDINEENVLFVNSNETMEFKGVKDISGFFLASGYGFSDKGLWEKKPEREARTELTKLLFSKYELLGELYGKEEFRNAQKEQKKYAKTNSYNDKPFELSVGADRLKVEYDGISSTLFIDGEKIEVPRCRDFFRYISGGWLEEYAYLYFRDKQANGEKIYDLRIGVKVFPKDEKKQNHQENQTQICSELDCVYTDGKRLYIVECKAGNVVQEHVQKLENNVRLYGGSAARGILFSSFASHAVLDRINRTPSLSAIVSKK